MDFLETPSLAFGFYALLISSPVVSILGYLILLRSEAFRAHFINIAGFPGAVAAGLVGVPAIIGFISGCTIASAITQRKNLSSTFVGAAQVFFLVLGFQLSLISPNSSGALMSKMLGSFTGLTALDSTIIIATSLLLSFFMVVFWRPLLFVSLQPTVADVRLSKLPIWNFAYMLILAVVAGLSASATGSLLAITILIAPAFSMSKLTSHPHLVVIGAAIISLALIFVGVVASYNLNIPTGATIALLGVLTALCSSLCARFR